MADLAGHAADAAVERAVEDDARRDACADAEVRQVVDVAEDAAFVEPGGRGTHVVLDVDRAAEALREGVAERQASSSRD